MCWSLFAWPVSRPGQNDRVIENGTRYKNTAISDFFHGFDRYIQMFFTKLVLFWATRTTSGRVKKHLYK